MLMSAGLVFGAGVGSTRYSSPPSSEAPSRRWLRELLIERAPCKAMVVK
jgi:hypothetical protein